jgi:hypothetical protein
MATNGSLDFRANDSLTVHLTADNQSPNGWLCGSFESLPDEEITVGTFVGILLQKGAKLWVVPTVLAKLATAAMH